MWLRIAGGDVIQCSAVKKCGGCPNDYKYNYHIIQQFYLAGIYLKDLKAGFQRVIRIPVFIAALFTIAKMWKQLELLTDKWISKV